MPLYEYACGSCGAVSERRRKMEQRLAPAACSRCGAETRPKLSLPSLVALGGTGPDVSCATAPPGMCCGSGACGPS